MKIKTLTKLTADCAETDAVMNLVSTTILDNPVKGFYRHMALGHAGLQITRGKSVVFISRDDLFKLGEAHCAELVPVESKPSAPAAAPAPAPSTAAVKPQPPAK